MFDSLFRCSQVVRHSPVKRAMQRFESSRRSFRDVGQWPVTRLGSEITEVRFLSSRPWGVDVVGGMRVLQTRWMGSSPIVSTMLAAVAERTRRGFPKLVYAGSNPAGSFQRARVAQGRATPAVRVLCEFKSRRGLQDRGTRIEDGGWRRIEIEDRGLRIED